MSPMDREARASRFIDAMDAFYDLVACRSPGLQLDAEPMGQLLSLLNDEAKKVVLRHVPNERAPGLTCANDADEDDSG